MPEAPLAERILQVDKLLGQLIQIPIPVRVAIHLTPGRFHRLIVNRGRCRVALGAFGVNRQPGFRHQVDRLVIQRRRGNRHFQLVQQLRPVRVRPQQRRAFIAEDKFDLTVLERLKPRRLPQERANGLVFRRRHGRQHRPGVHQLIEDPRHPRQHLERRRQLAQAHVFTGGLEFVEHQFHPQLGSLVLDDKEHFVVVRRQRVLGAEDFAQVQVIAVAHRLGKIQLGVMPFFRGLVIR